MWRALTTLWRPPTARRPRSPRPRWRLDRLEDRAVPAGNVLADLVGTTLTLVGDDSDNSVRLLPGGQPNEVVVRGVGTTVNGAAEQVFAGVESLVAHLLGGDDALVADGVTISSPAFSQVFVDGNAGDDRIELVGTAVHAAQAVDVQVYGERVSEGFASGTSGNDTIRILGSSLTAGAFVSVRLVGETNDGGVVTGGNDEITVADSAVVASDGFFHGVAVEIYGEINTTLGGRTGTIGGGNDRITVRDTDFVASSEATGFSFQNTAAVTIVGDANDVQAFDPETSAGADAAGSIGGGNDRIDVTNAVVAVRGGNFGTSQATLTVVGDRNFVSGFPGATATAGIGGGNDEITIAGSAVSASGAPSNGAVVEVRGEDVQVLAPVGGGTTSTVGGGNDRIGVTDVAVTADGPSADLAALVVRGEQVVAFGPGVSSVGGGNDVVTVRAVGVAGSAADDFAAVDVDTGSGNDRLEIADSAARFFTVKLGDGADRLTFRGNAIGSEASLDGGPGFDRLTARDNTGLVVSFGFEQVDA